MNRLLSIIAICLCQFVLLAQAGRAADTYRTGYYVQDGETHTAGETVSVDGNVATLTFGVAGDADFSGTTSDYAVDGFSAYLRGNGVNGTSNGGTLYIIRPNYNGYINVGVVLNANKKLYILEDDNAVSGYDGITATEQVRGKYGFYVKAGSTYKVYAAGTKLGFYGFEYIYTTDPNAMPAVYRLNVTTNLKRNYALYPTGSTIQEAGSTVNIETYSYGNNQQFKHWTANGEVVSASRSFTYTMPERDVDMVAVYEFNPSNPGNPASAENSYKLTLESKPARAGYFNKSGTTKVMAGEQTEVYCYQNSNGYVFKEWQIDGNRVSTDRNFVFEMPEHNITLTAVFVFNPQNPGNPGSNLFDAESGDLLLDDFTQGNIYDAAYNATKGAWEKVKSITVIGEVNQQDIMNLLSYSTNCEVLDFSRTTGMESLDRYSFMYGSTKLTTICLPATITQINSGTFTPCTSLTTLNVHAAIPPTLSSYAFGTGGSSIAGQVTVFVPANALSVYQSADVWKDMTIMAFTSEVCDIEINMPANAVMSDYKDMYLEAYNTISGQRLRYLITEQQTTYTFSNIIKNTTWDVSVKNAADEVIGEIKGIEVRDKDVSYTFESLKQPKTITLKVTTPDGTDVTSQVAINWTDQKDNFLTSGASVKKLLEGKEVKYSITLPEALAVQYQPAAGGEYTVTSGDNDITVQLTALPQQTISGKVTDKNKNSTALADAFIAISQTLHGQYTKTYAAKSDANGEWNMTVCDGMPTEVSASKKGYISQTVTKDTPEGADFDLEDINGSTIEVTLSYQPLDGEQTAYADINNVAYTITNETTGSVLSEYDVQYPNIALKDKLADGTRLSVTITSKNQKFAPMTASAEVSLNKASVQFTIKQAGAIKASYTESENSTCVGILYDANGLLMKRYEYDVNKELIIKDLPDGTYTLITMANSQFFNAVGQLSQFAESGLRNGVDYVKETIVVKSGVYVFVNVTRVPYFDETKLYYTGSNTSFTANKSQINAGQYLTLRGQVDFKDIYADQVSNVNLIVDLTENCDFVANSVMLGKNLVGYTLSGTQVIIPIGTSKEQVRFCVIPTKEGIYEPSASVSFTIGGKTILQPIGSAMTTVKGISITVPVNTAKKQFTASGTAIAKSDVYVYVDDVLAAKTTVKASGKWSAQCELIDPVDKSEHPVYARIVTPDKAELLTDTKTVTYDEEAILAEKVGMSFYNGWMHNTQNVNWNMVEKTVDKSSYMFYTTTDFTFTINFTNNVKPENVQLIVYKTNNTYDILDASYNSSKDVWVVAHRYNSSALPTAVKVKYVINGKQMTITEDSDDEGIEHSNPILDPSGYVYEAVSSNRLQGVTAYIYYREYVEDQYGDKHAKIGLWNAEEYAQQNPQFTDENGMYQWDVPNGEWQVRLEKEGYLNTNSEWLPVPPPQLDVNLPMTQMIQPQVKSGAKAWAEGVEFEFDKYMNPATLTAENITLTMNNEVVNGEIELLNEEAAYEGTTDTYATKVRINMPEGKELTSTDVIKLTISKNVESYAGVKMQQTYEQTFEVAPIVRGITIAEDDLVNVEYGKARTLKIGVTESAAAAGKTVTVQSMSEMIATVNTTSLTLDENGEAEFTITGELPGSTVINFTVDGTDVEYALTVNVKEAESLKTIAPRASRVTGAKLYRGDVITLSCDTEDATIKYTVDGSSPTGSGDNVIIYNENEPIIITDDQLTIKAIAKGKDMDASEEVEFSYELKKSNINYNMPEGWSWISHNMEEPIMVSEFQDMAERIVSQTDEVMKDPVYGFFGGLTQLEPAIGYKIKVTTPDSKSVSNNEYNAKENAVNVRKGWNWIGYPLSVEMAVEDALTYYDAAEGDMLIGQDGSAEYSDGEWHHGENFAMTPGKGYLFKASSPCELRFNTNTSGVAQTSSTNSKVSKRNWLIGSPWAYDKHAYPNIMSVTAELVVDGSKSNSKDYVVGAFNGDECVGVSQWSDDRLLMNVFGEGNSNVTFTAYNKSTEQYFEITETMQFLSGNQGTWNEPTTLTVGEEKVTGAGIVYNELDVLPAITRDHFTINAGGRYINKLTLTSMNGTTVMNLSNVGTGATITTNSLPNGVYIITVQAEGMTFYRKIVKANQ